MLDTLAMQWSSPQIDGVPPPPRMGCSASLVGTDVYVFGGSDGKTSLRDLHVLVYVTWFSPRWKGRAPEPRVGHTCTCVGNRLYVLGGASDGRGHNDLHVLDPATQVWSRPVMFGQPPGALVGHSSVLVGQAKPRLLCLYTHYCLHLLWWATIPLCLCAGRTFSCGA